MSLLHRIDRLTTGIGLWGAMLCLLTVAFLAAFQVLARFTFGHPPAWTEVIARSCLIWMVLLGAGPAFRHGAMISVDVILGVLPAAYKKALLVLITLSCLCWAALLGWYGTGLLELFRSQKLAGIGISISWVYAAFPVGAALCVPAILCWLSDNFPKQAQAHSQKSREGEIV